MAGTTGEAEKLTGSVGVGGRNIPKDVALIQSLLNRRNPLSIIFGLSETGQLDQATVVAIGMYQVIAVGMASPDWRIDPGGATFRSLIGSPRPRPAPNPSRKVGPIVTAVLKPEQFAQAEWQYLLDFTANHEYPVLNMYNTRGANNSDVTIGIGHALRTGKTPDQPPNDSEVNAWIRQFKLYSKYGSEGSPPDADAVKADWISACRLQRTGRNLSAYEAITTCRMPFQVAVDDMANGLKGKLTAVLRDKHTGHDLDEFKTFPAAVKIFIVSFSYGWIMGYKMKNVGDFSNLRASLRDGNYDVAATQCIVPGWSKQKNDAHRRLLEWAHQSKTIGRDPGTIPPPLW